MDGAAFKAELKRLGRTQVGFSEETGTALRTVHNWAASGPPSEVIRLLDLMSRLEAPFAEVRNESGSASFERLVALELDRLVSAAGIDRAEVFAKSVERWLEGRHPSSEKKAGSSPGYHAGNAAHDEF